MSFHESNKIFSRSFKLEVSYHHIRLIYIIFERSSKISDIDYPHILTFLLRCINEVTIHSPVNLFVITTLSNNYQCEEIFKSNWERYLNSEESAISLENKSIVLNWFILEFIPKITIEMNIDQEECAGYTILATTFVETLSHFYVNDLFANKWGIDKDSMEDLFPSFDNQRSVTILNTLFKLLNMSFRVDDLKSKETSKMANNIAIIVESSRFDWLKLVNLTCLNDLFKETLDAAQFEIAFLNIIEMTQISFKRINIGLLQSLVHLIGSLCYFS